MSEPPQVPKRILLPVDFSDCSQPAIELARDFAVAFGAACVVLRDSTDPFPTTGLPAADRNHRRYVANPGREDVAARSTIR